MADDFDIEAMLEAPYRKVGRIARLVCFFLCIHYLLILYHLAAQRCIS